MAFVIGNFIAVFFFYIIKSKHFLLIFRKSPVVDFCNFFSFFL